MAIRYAVDLIVVAIIAIAGMLLFGISAHWLIPALAVAYGIWYLAGICPRITRVNKGGSNGRN